MPCLLDTDSASLAFRGNERVRTRIRQAPHPGVWLSAIAAEEIVQGALGSINTNRNKAGSAAAYELFLESVESICKYRIHPFNKDAAALFASFPAQIKRLGSQDCRIAANSRRLASTLPASPLPAWGCRLLFITFAGAAL